MDVYDLILESLINPSQNLSDMHLWIGLARHSRLSHTSIPSRLLHSLGIGRRHGPASYLDPIWIARHDAGVNQSSSGSPGKIMSDRAVSLADRAENWGKLSLAALGLLFALGTVIVNVHLGTLGLSDFSSLRPRFVLVGLAFLIYTIIPPAFCLSILWAVRHAGLRRHPARALTAAAAVLITWLIMIPSLFLFFIPHITYRHPSFIAASGEVWALYLNPYGTLIEAMLICLPASILFIRHGGTSVQRRRGARIRSTLLNSLLVFAILLGSVGMIYPYATVTFVNISNSVGGGHPAIVTLKVTDVIGAELGRIGIGEGGAGENIVYGPFLMWHEIGDRTFLTVPLRKQSSIVLAIPSESIRVTRYVRGAVQVKSRAFGQADMTVDTDKIR